MDSMNEALSQIVEDLMYIISLYNAKPDDMEVVFYRNGYINALRRVGFELFFTFAEPPKYDRIIKFTLNGKEYVV